MCVRMCTVQWCVGLVTQCVMEREPAEAKQRSQTACLFTIFQIVFGLPIAFSSSLEGSVVKMKPTAPVLQEIVVSLKAKLRYNF